MLPHEEQIRIRDQARNLAWEQIAPPEVFAPQPNVPANRLSDAIARLQEDTQQRARLAHQALNDFLKEKVGSVEVKSQITEEVLRKLEPADVRQFRELEDYDARMREELYRGFESLDVMRR